jgi:hypothetical protein
MDNQKWWEYYAVRYFVGTVVGAFIVAILINKYSIPGYELKFFFGKDGVNFAAGMSLTAAAGLAFCYIASAPILTLHATRASFVPTVWGKGNWPCLFILFYLISVISILVATSSYLAGCATLFIGFIIFIQLFLLFVTFIDFERTSTFYFDLCKIRSKATLKKDDPPTANSDYVTAYRHLREHGNAFFILLLELILAFALYYLPADKAPFLAPALLFVWILPACMSWLIGTFLELSLIREELLKTSAYLIAEKDSFQNSEQFYWDAAKRKNNILRT